jgi:hypothetical protein
VYTVAIAFAGGTGDAERSGWMMKAIGNVLVSVVVFVVVVAALALAFDTKGCTEVAKRVVYGPPQEPVSVRLEISRDGRIEFCGEPEESTVATKTQVYEGAGVVSGTLRVAHQDKAFFISCATPYAMVDVGGWKFCIEDITTSGWAGSMSANAGQDPQPSAPDGTAATFAIWAESNVGPPGYYATWHEFEYFAVGGEPWSMERDFSISVSGRRLNRTGATTAGTGRVGKPVYAREVSYTDAWEDLDQPWDYAVSYSGWSMSGTQTADPFAPELYIPGLLAIDSVYVSMESHKGLAGYDFVDVELNWDDAPLELGGRAYQDGIFRVRGEGSHILQDLTVDSGLFNKGHQVILGKPLIYDFTKFRIPNRSDEDDAGLRISGGFKATNHYPSTLGWSTTP